MDYIPVMRVALIVLALAAACSGPEPEPVAPPAAEPPEPRRSMKGWELYCREVDSEPTFVLLVGTNRLKSVEEITNAPAARGLAGLRRLLKTLAKGQTVIGRAPTDQVFERDGYVVPWHNSDLGRAIDEEAEAAGVTVHLPDW